MRKATAVKIGAFSFLALLLVGCAKPGAVSSWSEELSAAQREIKGTNGDYVLSYAEARPLQEKRSEPEEPIECFVSLAFVSQKPTGTGEKGDPQYSHVGVHFNDYHLATTLRAETKVAVKQPPDPGWGEATRFVQLSPQDVLKATRAEGESFLGVPIDGGNISLDLLMASRVPHDINAPAVWNISFYRQDKLLTLFIDARNGSVLKRAIEAKNVGAN